MSEDTRKVVKYYSELFEREFTIIIDDKLGPVEIKGLVARKLEQANESLKKMKGLPKV